MAADDHEAGWAVFFVSPSQVVAGAGGSIEDLCAMIDGHRALVPGPSRPPQWPAGCRRSQLRRRR